MIITSLFYATTFLCFWTDIFYAVPVYSVVATMNVGINPAGIAITPDNKLAYVANLNDWNVTGENSVSVLNLANNTVLQTITDINFIQPWTVTINPAGTKAYVTNSNSDSISIINLHDNTVTTPITGLNGPSGMVISLNGDIGYVNNYGYAGGAGTGDTVSVIDLVSNTIIHTITVGQAPTSLAMTSDGAFVYVTNYVDGTPNSGTVQVIQTSGNAIVATIPDFSGPYAIALTQDNKYGYITNFGSNNFSSIGQTVTVIDLTNKATIATINLGIQPAGIAISPDGMFAYVTNYNTLYSGASYTGLLAGQGTVNIIDIATNAVISPTIVVGQSPDWVVIAPDGQYAYVSNYSSNSTSVIALPTFQIVAQGLNIQNRYLTQIESVNELRWTVSGISLPFNYSIYRDAQLMDLAGTVLATEPLVFLDYNRIPNTTYTYYIVGTNQVGTTSEPVVVVIN